MTAFKDVRSLVPETYGDASHPRQQQGLQDRGQGQRESLEDAA